MNKNESDAPDHDDQLSDAESQRRKTRLERRKLAADIHELRVWSPIKVIVGIATGFLTLTLAYCGFFYQNGPLQERIKLERERVALEKLRVESERGALNLAAKQLGQVFSAVVAEPSDMANTCLRSERGSPLFLVVDDEIRFPVLVEAAGNELLPIQRLDFDRPGGVQNDMEVGRMNDIEVVASLPHPTDCSQWRYLIASSHRKVDEKDETRVLRFTLNPEPDRGRFIVSEIQQFSLAPGIIEYMSESAVLDIRPACKDGKAKQNGDCDRKDKSYELERRQWWKKSDKDRAQPYALEIEAAAAIGDEFWVGLKFPLKNRDGSGKHHDAVLFRYSLEEMRTTSNDPVPGGHKILDLAGQGISAMTACAPSMLVVSNPSQQDHPNTWDAYNKSRLHVFTVTADRWDKSEESDKLAVSYAKAEGIALSGDQIWTAYDGSEGALVPRAIGDVTQKPLGCVDWQSARDPPDDDAQ